jgi:hypothetical protein
MQNAWENQKFILSPGNLMRRHYILRDLGVDRRIIGVLEWIFEKRGVEAWSGFIWLNIGSSGGLL